MTVPESTPMNIVARPIISWQPRVRGPGRKTPMFGGENIHRSRIVQSGLPLIHLGVARRLTRGADAGVPVAVGSMNGF
jgi:hypothetical protein